jgi:hypothetical protein
LKREFFLVLVDDFEDDDFEDDDFEDELNKLLKKELFFLCFL